MGFCDHCDCTILQRTNWICSWFWVETTKEPRWNVYTMGFDMLASASKLLSPSLGYFLHTLSMCSWSSQFSSRKLWKTDQTNAWLLSGYTWTGNQVKPRNHICQDTSTTYARQIKTKPLYTPCWDLLAKYLYICIYIYSWQKSEPKKTKQTHDIALSQNQNVRRTMAICRPELLSHKNESKNLRENNPPTCPRTQTYEVYHIFSNLQKI